MAIKIHKITFPNSIFALLTITNIIRLFAIIPVSFGNILYILIGSISLFYCISKKGIKNESLFLGIILLYTAFGVLSFFYNSNMDPQELLWPVGFMSIGLLIYEYDISYKNARISYYVLCLALIYEIVMVGGVDDITISGSRNTISIFVVLYYSFLLISLYKSGMELQIIDPVVGALVCILGTGRSGILTGSIMIVFYVSQRFDLKKLRMKRVFAFAIGVILVLIVLNQFYSRYNYIIDNALLNFKLRGLDSAGRNELWIEYLRKAISTPFDFILGAGISGTPMLDQFNNNLHNSFLMLHAKYGIITMILIICLMIKSLRKMIKEKEPLLITAFILMLFRMNFDYTNFNGNFDTILIFFLLYGIRDINIKTGVLNSNNYL